MKLATKLGIATAGVALSFSAFGANSAEAASVKFLGQSGNRYDYAIELDSANLAGDFETLRAGSFWFLSGLAGVTNATVEYPTRASVLATDDDFAGFESINFASTGKVGSLAPRLSFSIFSSAPKTGEVEWFILRRDPGTGYPYTAFNGKVVAPVPEPFTIGGSAVALGFGWWMKRKKAAASEKV